MNEYMYAKGNKYLLILIPNAHVQIIISWEVFLAVFLTSSAFFHFLTAKEYFRSGMMF